MTDEDAFIRAIVAAPDEDGPRLVYADWLEERGDPRGEFIRVQIEYARLGVNNPVGRPLLMRERELLFPARQRWLETLAGVPMLEFTFRRGFLNEVKMTVETFLTHAGDLFDRHPVRELRLTSSIGTHNLGRRLADCRYLNRPRLLSLRSSGLGDADIVALCDSPFLDGLAELELGYGADAPAIDALIRCPFFGRLNRLQVSVSYRPAGAAHDDEGAARRHLRYRLFAHFGARLSD